MIFFFFFKLETRFPCSFKIYFRSIQNKKTLNSQPILRELFWVNIAVDRTTLPYLICRHFILPIKTRDGTTVFCHWCHSPSLSTASIPQLLATEQNWATSEITRVHLLVFGHVQRNRDRVYLSCICKTNKRPTHCVFNLSVYFLPHFCRAYLPNCVSWSFTLVVCFAKLWIYIVPDNLVLWALHSYQG